MALGRDDRVIQDGLGNALAGAQVYWCTQPANTSTIPPSPLAPIYSDSGGTPTSNPQLTDGFGQAGAYMLDNLLYTVVANHPLFVEPLVLIDQAIGGGSGGVGYVPFEGTPQGTIDGTNTVFTLVNNATPLTTIPVQMSATVNGITLKPGLGYTVAIISGVSKITYAQPPQPALGGSPADALYAQGLITS